MCEVNAFLCKEDKEELILANVDRVVPQEDGILLEDIFGRRHLVKARLKEMALIDHKIVLEEI